MEWLDKATQGILSLIAHREVLAIALGLLISIGGTQYVKFQFTDHLTRLRLNLLALPLGAIPTFLIFPIEYGWQLRAVFAAAVGVSAPIAYKGVIWAIGLKWPQLADRASADL